MMALSDFVSGTVFETDDGTEFVETPNSMKLNLAGTKLSGTREFIVQWVDRLTFAKELTGAIQSDGNDPERFVRTPPLAYPGISNLICISADMSGMGAQSFDSTTSAATYDLALVAASYAIVPLPPGSSSEDDQVLETREVDYSPEIFTYGTQDIEWTTGDAINQDVPITKLLITKARTYTRPNVSRLPEAAINDAIGKMNSKAYDGVDASRLLFIGATSRKTEDSEGNIRYELVYQFLERVGYDWDQFFDPSTSTGGAPSYRNIQQRGGAALTIYETTDFAALFTATA